MILSPSRSLEQVKIVERSVGENLDRAHLFPISQGALWDKVACDDTMLIFLHYLKRNYMSINIRLQCSFVYSVLMVALQRVKLGAT